MKYPNHIILDFNYDLISNSSQYWVLKYIYFIKNDIIKINYKFIDPFKKNPLSFLTKKFFNQKKFTIRFNCINEVELLSNTTLNLLKKILKPRLKIKKRNIFINNFINNFYKHVYYDKTVVNLIFFKKLAKEKLRFKVNIFKSNKLWKLFDLNFFKKEKIYTKLKYSRTPQYDIVSGGIAALFAAFLGFLITEKFGFELVDSGDFYFLFMYLVFLGFFFKLFLKLFDSEKYSYNPFSYKWFLQFFKIIFFLIIRFFKNLFFKV